MSENPYETTVHPPQITASVTEPQRVPRPTLYGHAYEDGCWLFFGAFSTKEAAACNLDGAIHFTVPGELEQARAAKIEQAREAVIQAAKRFGPDIDAPAYLENALDALRTAEEQK